MHFHELQLLELHASRLHLVTVLLAAGVIDAVSPVR